MRLQILASALALSGSATAFSDSWPLVMFSTSQFSDATSNNHVQTRSQAIEQVRDLLASCPTDNYVLIAQEGVNAADIRRPKAMPSLHQAVVGEGIHGKFIVPEVVGDAMDADAIQSYIQTVCHKQAKKVEPHFTLIKHSGDEKNAISQWKANEKWMKDSYTVLFVGTPSAQAKSASSSKKASASEKTIYESEFIEPMHMDTKRDVSDDLSQAKNSTRDTRSLFEKYQFFTPGIFMALITAILLFSILGVGLRALASLEVSYGSFEKDMGPSAQKKQ
ncbi:ER BIG1 [Fusarium heterosporum]|uniref:Protein BIG1 n=1 Tax=Fusarium heterosporum TaxID=42747 RepID=A0A8H5TL94_FUSHE|nr:ER BIG1 [Fusarium heterosporum]